MPVTHYYVDPQLDSNTGTGTLLDPFGDLQFCFDSINLSGYWTQVNVKSSAPEVLAAGLTLTGDYNKFLHLKGYDTAADDGGQCTIDLAGNNVFSTHVYAQCIFQNVDFANMGAGRLWAQAYIGVLDCNFSGFTGTNPVSLAVYSYLRRCRFTNINNSRISCPHVISCFVEGVAVTIANGSIYGNVLNNVEASAPGAIVAKNIIHSDGSVGSVGVNCQAGAARIFDNVIWNQEIGLRVNATANDIDVSGNSIFNCGTPLIDLAEKTFVDSTTVAAVDPFVNPPSDFKLSVAGFDYPGLRSAMMAVVGRVPGLVTNTTSELVTGSGGSADLSPFNSSGVFG